MFKTVITIGVAIVALLLTLSCQGNGGLKEENESLKASNNELAAENKKLRTEKAELEKELEELKETPGYRYKVGLDYFDSGRYESAVEEFEYVIERFPDSEYTEKARTKLKEAEKEIARIERELREEEKRAEEARKYEPRNEIEANAEWIDFRNNESERKGTVTTWRLRVMYFSREDPLCRLGGGSGKDVVVLGPEGYTYLAGAAFGKVPIVREDDWIVVTGRFEYVSSDGVIALSPIKVINEGYR